MKFLVALFLVAFALIPAMQIRVDRARGSMGHEPDVTSVWTGPVVRSLSFGFSDLLADLYWMRAVQYYGRQKIAGTGFADLYPLLATSAALDPRFSIVYQYGAVFLSEPHPIGAGMPKQGVAFIKEGADRNPLLWRLRQDQGFYTFLYLKDPQGAAEALRLGSYVPGAAPWLAPMAGFLLMKGGELDEALRVWTIVHRESPPGFLRQNAEEQMSVVQNRILARTIQTLVNAHYGRTRDRRATLEQLKTAGVVPAFVDMSGTPFDFEPATGAVRVSPKSPLWRSN